MTITASTTDPDSGRRQLLEDILYLAVGTSRLCKAFDPRIVDSGNALEREEALCERDEAVAKLHAGLAPVASAWLAELPDVLAKGLDTAEDLHGSIEREILPIVFARAGLGDDFIPGRRLHSDESRGEV